MGETGSHVHTGLCPGSLESPLAFCFGTRKLDAVLLDLSLVSAPVLFLGQCAASVEQNQWAPVPSSPSSGAYWLLSAQGISQVPAPAPRVAVSGLHWPCLPWLL